MPSERIKPNSLELPKVLLRGAKEHYGECYGLKDEPGKTKKTKLTTIRGGVPPIEQHFNSETKIGLFPFADKRHVDFGAIDIDDYGLDIPGLQKKCKDLGLNPLIISSTNGGCHIYFYFKTPILAYLVREKLNRIAEELGYPGTEVFPKGDIFKPERTPKGGWKGLGNFIYLPYGKYGNSYALDDEGNELSVEDFFAYVVNKEIDFTELPKFEDKREPRSILPEVVTPTAPVGVADIMVNAPPCMQLLHYSGVKEGSRNNAMFDFAVLEKKANGSVSIGALRKYNEKFTPKLNVDEMELIAEQVNDNDYFYKCNDKPIAEFCNKEVCKQRLLGLGQAQQVDLKKYPFVYIEQKDRFADNVSGKKYRSDHFKRMLSSRKIKDREDKLVTKPEQYINIPSSEVCFDEVFDPREGPRLTDDRGRSLFNTYRKPELQTEEYTQEDIEHWDRYLTDLIPNENYRHTVNQYIAHVITKPGVKIKWAVLLITKQGRGKDLLARAIKACIGKEYFAPLDMALLKQPQTGHMLEKVMVVFSETKEQTDKVMIMEQIKQLITDPELKIREMHTDAYWVDNLVNFIFFSNHKTAVTLDNDARRLMVLMDDKPRKDREFYAPIWDLVENHPGKILKYYQEYDLTGFSAVGNAPVTEFLGEVVEATTNHLFITLDMLFAEKMFPFQQHNPYVNIMHLANAMAGRRKDFKITPGVIKTWLQKLKSEGKAKKLTDIDFDDSRPTIWTLSPDTHNEMDRVKLRDVYRLPNPGTGQDFFTWNDLNPPF
tara:strand:+ start:1293 stop:3605 length:2313 start_codon:yes stop_codon:yes gene_type:complete